MTHAAPNPEPKQGYFLSNRLYDVTKQLAQVILPALGTLYFALAGIWGLPNAEGVVGTIVAVDAFLGVLLSISSKSYESSGAKYDGVMNVIEQPDGSKLMDLELHKDPGGFDQAKDITFKVNKPGL